MNEVNWQNMLRWAISDSNTSIVVNLDGVTGASTYSKFMSAAQQGIGGGAVEGNYFNWEMGQIYQAGQEGNVSFMQGREMLPNPFQ